MCFRLDLVAILGTVDRTIGLVGIGDHQARVDELVEREAAERLSGVRGVRASVVGFDPLHDRSHTDKRSGRRLPGVGRRQIQDCQKCQGGSLVLLLSGQSKVAKHREGLVDPVLRMIGFKHVFQLRTRGAPPPWISAKGRVSRFAAEGRVNGGSQLREARLARISESPKVGSVDLGVSGKLPEVSVDTQGVQVRREAESPVSVQRPTSTMEVVQVVFDRVPIGPGKRRVDDGRDDAARLLLG